MTKKRGTLMIIWIACGFFNYGSALGYFTHEFPWDNHVGIARFMALTGPFGLPPTLIFNTHLWWRIAPMTIEERWAAHAEHFPGLTRKYFDEHDD